MAKKPTKDKSSVEKSALPKLPPKTLAHPVPQNMTKQQKRIYLQQKLWSLQQLDYDAIIERFAPTLETVKNNGTMRMAAYAAGISVDELRLLLEFGRFGGSEAWTQFYEEFFRVKAAADLTIMKHLHVCAEAGEKWAIQRAMGIMEPEDFAAYDAVSDQSPTAPTGITQHFYNTKTEFTEQEILDAEEVKDTN